MLEFVLLVLVLLVGEVVLEVVLDLEGVRVEVPVLPIIEVKPGCRHFSRNLTGYPIFLGSGILATTYSFDDPRRPVSTEAFSTQGAIAPMPTNSGSATLCFAFTRANVRIPGQVQSLL